MATLPFVLGGPTPNSDNGYTATNLLLPSLKRRALVPNNTTTLADTDFLALATEELLTDVFPFLVSLKEEYGVASVDVAVTANVTDYPLPSRASGMALRQVRFQTQGSDFLPLNRIEPERTGNYGSASGGPQGYLLENNTLRLVPTPSSGGTLRLTYFRRPNALVAETTDCAQISAINTTTHAVTLVSVPSTFATTSSGAPIYDLISGRPGFDTLAMDQSATLAGSTLTFTTLPTNLAVGDFVCIAGESPIPQIPPELHPLLVERTVTTALEALGDKQAAVTDKRAESMRKKVLPVLMNRVQGSDRVFINYNGPGWNSSRRRW